MRIYGNFKDTISGSSSSMQHVRTDLVEYLKEDDLYITRLQFLPLVPIQKYLCKNKWWNF